MPSLAEEVASISVEFSMMTLEEASRLNKSKKTVSERKGDLISSNLK